MCICIFILGLNAVTTGINTDDYALPRRHIVVLRNLSRNDNIMITPSDKGGGDFIMDITTTK